MPKYKLIFNGVEEDELFNTEEEAEEVAAYYRSCSEQGAEELHMNNPGDYDYNEDTYVNDDDYEIVEVEEE